MINVKKMTSVFATLFCMGQNAMVKASATVSIDNPSSSTLEDSNLNKNQMNADSSDAHKIDDRIHRRIVKSLPLSRDAGRVFLFNFHGAQNRPSMNLEEGEVIYSANVPDFKGLRNCGINYDQALMFYNEAQTCIRLKTEKWKKEYDSNIGEYQISKKLLEDKLSELISLVKRQAIDYYINYSKNTTNNQLQNLKKYSENLANSIEKFIDGLQNSDLSESDIAELNTTVKEYAENPSLKLMWYNKVDVFPLRNIIIKLGEAKIIHLYTKLLLKVIDNIDDSDHWLIDELSQTPSTVSNEKNINIGKDDVIGFILDDESTLSRKLNEELSKMIMAPDGFFDRFNNYENYMKNTQLPRYNRFFNN